MPGPEPPRELPRPEASDLPVPSILQDQPPVAPRPEEPAPPADAPPVPEAPVPPERPPSKVMIPDSAGTRGLIAVRVPAQARVFINGLETKSRGPYREYVSFGLKPGLTYKYEIRAEITRQGRLVNSTRTVYLTAGARKLVALPLEAEPEEAVAALW